jgi:hypothetical protein
MEPNPFQYSRSPSHSPIPYQSKKFRFSSPSQKVSTALPSPDTTPQPPSRFSESPEESLPTPPEDFPSSFRSSNHGFYDNWRRERSMSVVSSTLSSIRSRSVSLSVEPRERSESRQHSLSVSPSTGPTSDPNSMAERASTPNSTVSARQSTPQRLPSINQAMEVAGNTKPSILRKYGDNYYCKPEKYEPLVPGQWMRRGKDGFWKSQLHQYKLEDPKGFKETQTAAEQRYRAREATEEQIRQDALARDAAFNIPSRARDIVMAYSSRSSSSKRPRVRRSNIVARGPTTSAHGNGPSAVQISQARPSAPRAQNSRKRPAPSGADNPRPEKKRNAANEKPKHLHYGEIAQWFSVIPEITPDMLNKTTMAKCLDGWRDKNKPVGNFEPKRISIPANHPYRQLLVEAEIEAAAYGGWSLDQFLIHKLRLFKGRYEELVRDPKKIFNKTRAQSYGQIDVNNSSRLWTLYTELGMLEHPHLKATLDNGWNETAATQDLKEIVARIEDPETALEELARLRTAYRGQSQDKADSMSPTTETVPLAQPVAA